jgi:uncharacterized protein YqgC (DUF456 family)
MELFLTIAAILLVIVGILGSILPVLPGTPLCWLGLLAIHFTEHAEYTVTFLVIMALIMIALQVLDYFIPIWGTKRFGGTKAGVTGSTIGLFAGVFLGPVGIIAGPFLGALLAELIVNPNEVKRAWKSATGSFVGFLLGTGLKLIYGGFTAWYVFGALV